MNIELNTRGIASVIFRQFWICAAIFFVILALGIMVILKSNPVYQARGSMLARFSADARPTLNMPDNRQAASSGADRTELIQSNIKILKSHNLLGSIIREIGPDRLYPGITAGAGSETRAVQSAIDRTLSGPLMIGSDNSNVIEVFYKNGNPDITVVFVNTLMEKFIKLQTEVFNTPQTSFLQQQTNDAKMRLEEAQTAFQTFKEETGISAIDEEMTQLINERGEISKIAFQAVNDAQTRLAELESEAAKLQSTYRSDSPTMKQLNASIWTAKKELDNRQEALRGSKNDSSNKSEEEQKAAPTNSVAKRMSVLNSRIAYLEEQRARYRELEQQVEINDMNYVYYKQRGEEARVNSLLNSQNITRFAIIDRPSTPRYPISPNKKLILLMSILGGLFAALGAALGLEIMDDRFTRPEHITSALKVPVFTTFDKREKAS